MASGRWERQIYNPFKFWGVSDGYVNSRVIKFSEFGEFQFEWGTKGSGPGQLNLPHGQFRMAHDIAVGRDGAVYVVDVEGMRVQKFLPE